MKHKVCVQVVSMYGICACVKSCVRANCQAMAMDGCMLCIYKA